MTVNDRERIRPALQLHFGVPISEDQLDEISAGDANCYDLDVELKLQRNNNPADAAWMKKNVGIAAPLIKADAARRAGERGSDELEVVQWGLLAGHNDNPAARAVCHGRAGGGCSIRCVRRADRRIRSSSTVDGDALRQDLGLLRDDDLEHAVLGLGRDAG